jgi:RNA polymerase sigma factor (sigma-70 family)
MSGSGIFEQHPFSIQIFRLAVTLCIWLFTYNVTEMDIKKRLTDKSLIEALRSDEAPDDAIRYLYREQFGLTAAYIRQNSGTQEDAEDIFQEVVLVFIEILKKDKFRNESSVSTFLYALTRNIWLNELKKRGKSKLRDEIFEKEKGTEELDISHFLVNRELKSELMQLVDKLGETCKKILMAFYFENLAIREILQNLNYENEQVVRNKKYKCLKQLEQMLTAQPVLAKNLKSILFYE